ncbi:baseplate assembly protein [Hydrogenophaga sp.]|uniref:baseplate assembly protein n=1 Tax=Hydrogenophaga sp. TaxID=1904254 RepID=UPI003F725E4D
MIDMTLLPAPQVIEPLDFEAIYQQRLARMLELHPEFTEVLESDPAIKLLQVMAFQELLLRQRINDAARACMLAYATGTDLDQLAANFQVQRLVLDPGNPTATPPVPPTFETDARLRERTQAALEGISTAGSRESYRWHAMSSSAQVADVGVDSPDPGVVRLTVLAATESGIPTTGLLDTVAAAVNAEHVRPLCDAVQVQAPAMLETAITATLHTLPGPAGEVGAQAAEAALTAWLAQQRRLGAGLPRSGIFAALHQPGVARVVLTEPAADVLADVTECVQVTAITLTTEVVSDD